LTSYWSATTVADIPAGAWLVDFNNGIVTDGDRVNDVLGVWCVRGAMQESVY
jgi:hypothetical protein